MNLILDKYGLVLDGGFREGYIIVAHPQTPEPTFAYRIGEGAPQIELTVLPNIRMFTCHSSLLAKLRFVWGFAKFIFRDLPKGNVQTEA